jgi:SAM-dependent methyltransferase
MSNSVDVVISVESSHCYPSRPRFFEEVERILRPGGSFLFADLILSGDKSEGMDVVSPQLNEAGLIIEECIDIAENVLAARDAVSSSNSFRSRMRESMPLLVVPIVEESLWLTGTELYAKLASRRVRYLQWRASKPGENTIGSSVAEAVVG